MKTTNEFFSRLGLFSILAFAMMATGCASKKGAGADGSRDSAYGGYGTGASASGGIGLGTLERVHFPFDSSNLDEKSRDTLQNNARVIMQNPKMRILVEGHTDERGSNEYNIALGERRSKATIDYLVNLGVQRSRLEMKSWGEERPLDPSKSSDAFALNRRAEFVILAK